MFTRPLFGLAGSFVLGEVLALSAAARWVPVLAVLLGLAAAVSLSKIRQSRGMKMLLLFLAAGLLGYGRAAAVREQLFGEMAQAQKLALVSCRITGRVEQIQEKEDSLSLLLGQAQAESGSDVVSFGRLKVYIKLGQGTGDESRESLAAQLAVGNRVEMRGTIEAAEPASNPGQFDYRLYAMSQGWSCQAYGENLKRTEAEESPYFENIRRIRRDWAERLAGICPAGDLGIFRAVLLGDRSQMDQDLWKLYQRQGISALLAVSGQHLSLAAGGVYLIFRKLGLSRKNCGLLAGFLAVGYGVLTGASGSAMRAVVMICCLWLAAWLGRSYDCLSALGLAAMCLSARSPYLLFQSGFQLSFGAVLAIGGLAPWLIKRLELQRPWQKSLAVAVSLQLVTAPAILWHFFRYPLYGVVLNLLVMPLAPMLIYSGFLGLGLSYMSLEAGKWGIGAGHYVIALYEKLCRLFERLPGSSLLLGRPDWRRLWLYGGLVACLLLAVGFKGRRKENCQLRESDGMAASERSEGRKTAVWPGLALLWGALAVGIFLLRSGPPGGLRITCLDVGQGDGLVLESNWGTVLMDGGSSSEKQLASQCLVPFLESHGVGRIDCAVVSHGDSDHLSGLKELLEGEGEIPIRRLILPRLGRNHKACQELAALAEKRGTRVDYMQAGDILQVGELELRCLYAGDPDVEEEPEPNRHSLVIRASFGKFRMLFTGDMDAECEAGLLASPEGRMLQGIQVLKTAHHGSDTSSSLEFLQAVHPQTALISYGKDNSYGHPSPEVKARMEEMGIQMWETAQKGAIILEIKGEKLEIYGVL